MRKCYANANMLLRKFVKCSPDVKCSGAPNRGGWGSLNPPPEFWMGGLNTCQPPLILRKIFFRGGWLPLN